MKTILRQNPINDCIELWIINESYKTLSLAKPIELIFEEVKEDDVLSEPTLKIPRSHEFFQSLMKELTCLGIKSEDEYTIKGKLDATSYHLEDLRTLLKLKKNDSSKKK